MASCAVSVRHQGNGALMPDIAMCQSATCPSRHICHRYMAMPGMHQAYMDFESTRAGRERCDDFIRSLGKFVADLAGDLDALL